MVVFTEVMADLVRNLNDFELTVTEESVTIRTSSQSNRRTLALTPSKMTKIKNCPNFTEATLRGKSKRISLGIYEYNGEQHSVKEWAEIYHVSPKRMSSRLVKGYPPSPIYKTNENSNIKKG